MALPEPLKTSSELITTKRRPRTRRPSSDTQPIRLHPTQGERNAEMLSALEANMLSHLRGGDIPHAHAEQVVDESLRVGVWDTMQHVGKVKGISLDTVPYEDRTGTAFLVLTGIADGNGDTPAVVGKTAALPHQSQIGISSIHYRKLSGE